MPSKINSIIVPIITSIDNLEIKINNNINLYNILKSNYNLLKSQIINVKSIAEKALNQNKSYGLIDLIANKTPTYSGWTENPTDGGNITDNNITTFCITGNKVTDGAWQYCYIEWDLKKFYNIMLSGVGSSLTTVGSSYISIYVYDGTTWIRSHYDIAVGNTNRFTTIYSGKGSKIRIALTSSAASTIQPNIREFNVWRLN